jgi:glycosyltransferase involved in cell wall biosynthesis
MASPGARVTVRTAALVPAYNAGSSIGAVVATTRPVLSPVVVVDDGSRDDTAARAASAGAEVLRHAVNQGKGAALVTGMRHLDQQGFARALTLDADGQHLPDQIPLLLAAADAAPRAIVIGVRRKEGFEIRRIARFGNWVADRFMRWIAGQPLPDTQSGFRIYPVAATLALGTRDTISRPRSCCAPRAPGCRCTGSRSQSTIRP